MSIRDTALQIREARDRLASDGTTAVIKEDLQALDPRPIAEALGTLIGRVNTLWDATGTGENGPLHGRMHALHDSATEAGNRFTAATEGSTNANAADMITSAGLLQAYVERGIGGVEGMNSSLASTLAALHGAVRHFRQYERTYHGTFGNVQAAAETVPMVVAAANQYLNDITGQGSEI